MEYSRDFALKVMRKEIVAAALPVQHRWLPQSNLDLLLPPVGFAVFFCYKKPAGTGGKNNLFTFSSMVGLLKKALAQALVPYYALAGELVHNAVGEPAILCNNRGVDFFEAFADVELKHINLYNPDQSIQGKLLPVKAEGVLSVQATELKCGGLVVACTFDHRVADAYSANMFLVSWAEIAQSKQLLSVLPSFQRSLLSPRFPPHYHPSLDGMYVPISALPPPPNNHPGKLDNSINNGPMISRIYYVKADHLNWLQTFAGCNGRRNTKIEAFSAFLWKTMVAREDASDKKCRMGIVVDGRTRLSDKAKTMSSYFGNVLSIPFSEKRSSEIKGRELSWVADTVHECLQPAVTKEHFLGLIDWVEAHGRKPSLAKIYAGNAKEVEDDGPTLVVSSGKQFPVEKVDFGWGKAVFGSYHFPWDGEAGYVMPMASPSGNGDWVVYMHMLKRQLEVIETEAAHFLRPLTADYLNI